MHYYFNKSVYYHNAYLEKLLPQKQTLVLVHSFHGQSVQNVVYNHQFLAKYKVNKETLIQYVFSRKKGTKIFHRIY